MGGGTSCLWVSGWALVAWSPTIAVLGGQATLPSLLQGGPCTGLI